MTSLSKKILKFFARAKSTDIDGEAIYCKSQPNLHKDRFTKHSTCGGIYTPCPSHSHFAEPRKSRNRFFIAPRQGNREGKERKGKKEVRKQNLTPACVHRSTQANVSHETPTLTQPHQRTNERTPTSRRKKRLSVLVFSRGVPWIVTPRAPL